MATKELEDPKAAAKADREVARREYINAARGLGEAGASPEQMERGFDAIAALGMREIEQEEYDQWRREQDGDDHVKEAREAAETAADIRKQTAEFREASAQLRGDPEVE